MDPIVTITWKHHHAPNLRCFGNAQAAIQGGEDPNDLHLVAGVLVKWPAELGALPDAQTLAVWEAERLATEAPS